ncbi:hypothetical protein [Streptomyces sp. NPDC020681]|uniref:hypothetical protein n=1 Tax=Streptomyces sp. NPDC020681 TaxID=3365083 RepID=UPI0037A83430
MPKKAIQPAYDELAAAAVVNSVLGTETLSFDDQSEPGMIDFMLGKAGASAASDALEVSSTLNGKTVAMWKQLNRIYNGEPIEGLGRAWGVQFQDGATIGKGASERLIALLADLEGRDVKKVSQNYWEYDEDWTHGVPTAQQRQDLESLRELGINVVHQLGASEDIAGRIYTTSAMPTGIALATADAVSPYVDEFLTGPTGRNKIDKLRIKGAGKRQHLFIWSDSSHTSIGAALKHGFIPTDAPSVPEHIDYLWLGSFFSFENVYTWRRSEGWQVLDVAAAVSSVKEPS